MVEMSSGKGIPHEKARRKNLISSASFHAVLWSVLEGTKQEEKQKNVVRVALNQIPNRIL